MKSRISRCRSVRTLRESSRTRVREPIFASACGTEILDTEHAYGTEQMCRVSNFYLSLGGRRAKHAGDCCGGGSATKTKRASRPPRRGVPAAPAEPEPGEPT